MRDFELLLFQSILLSAVYTFYYDMTRNRALHVIFKAIAHCLINTLLDLPDGHFQVLSIAIQVSCPVLSTCVDKL